MDEDELREWVESQPAIDSPATRAAAALIARVYEESSVGGNLHVQIDDGNIEDRFFDRLEAYGSPVTQAESECFAALKALSLRERWSALLIHNKR